MFVSDDINDTQGNVAEVNFALIYASFQNLASSKIFHFAMHLVDPVTLGILCDMRCSREINHFHGKCDCCVQVSCTCAAKKC